MSVAVTGASGFVGRALSAALLKQGHEVVALVRRSGTAPAGTREVLIQDLHDASGIALALTGVAQVVHLAARVHVMQERAADPIAAFRGTNVAGTMQVYRTACAASVRRFIFMSSVKVNGEGREAPYHESDMPAPQDPYGQSKLEAEQALAAARRAGGTCEVAVLRSPLMYGPGVRGNFLRLCRLADIARRWPLPLGGIPNHRSLVAVTNLASAVMSATFEPAAADRTYLVSDGVDFSTSQLLEHLAHALGGPARLTSCPVGVLRAVAGLVGRRAEADRLFGSLTVDSSRIRQELGWTPPVPAAAALAETARAWKATGA